ncbi:MAG: hypothetical protein ACYTDW_03695 [Planctomycetota bacterium]|jgi:hypothetical protein
MKENNKEKPCENNELPTVSDFASEEAYSVVLIDHKVEADDKVEAYLKAPPGYVITGLGSRAH